MTATQKAMLEVEKAFNVVTVDYEKEKKKVDNEIAKMEAWRKSLSIGFSANHFSWTSDESRFAIYPSVLKADNVETNFGKAYDSKTGVFTAPSDGFYFFAATCSVDMANGVNKDGSKQDRLKEAKWHDDIMVNINRYDKDKPIKGTGEGADKIGEIWLGESGSVGADSLRLQWHRKSGSAIAAHWLKKGEKVCLEFVVWNGAEKGDKVNISFNFTGARLF